MGPRFIKYLFAIALLLLSFSLYPDAECYADDGKAYDISQGDIVISKSGNYTVTGSTDQYTLTVEKGVSTNIWLKNVTIANESTPVQIMSGAAANFILVGENSITSAKYAAIHVPEGAKFIISSRSLGSLAAAGGRNGSGIGGSLYSGDTNYGTGTIIIKGGTIDATGGYLGCGIGGGASGRNLEDEYYSEYNPGAGNITICGGTVTAIGGTYGTAGIGGSSMIKQGRITISGGTVNASSFGAGIGSENSRGKGNVIQITGGLVNANGNNYAAGIGDSLDPSHTTVSISGGMVTAKGDHGDRVLDEYGLIYTSEIVDSLKAEDIAAEKIIISGGNIYAYTFSKQPVNAKGKEVFLALYNCKEADITSIKVNGDIYGAEGVVSQGYLSLYLPSGTVSLAVQSEEGTILKMKSYLSSWEPIKNGRNGNDKEIDLSKGNAELVEGGYLYRNKAYKSNTYTIYGTTSEYNINVHNSDRRVYTVTFDNVNVNYGSGQKKEFLILDNDVKLNVNLKGENSCIIGAGSLAIFAGNETKLSFTGESEEASMKFTGGEESKVIFTNSGNVSLYGGSLYFTTAANSAAVYLGNFGTFSMYGGRFESTGTESMSITGRNYLQVDIHGGSLQVNTIGTYENGNEEIGNHTDFTFTGGSVEVLNRIIFSNYTIYGGDLKARILGCGTGCKVTMYAGNMELGAFVNYTEYEFGIVPDIMSQFLYGGTVVNRNDVPQEELSKIRNGAS